MPSLPSACQIRYNLGTMLQPWSNGGRAARHYRPMGSANSQAGQDVASMLHKLIEVGIRTPF